MLLDRQRAATHWVTVCPWWDGESARRKIGGQISRDFARKQSDPTIGTWTWVYHAPPSGSPTCWDGKKHYGDAALVKWIDFYQPDLVFTGHIHQAPFSAAGSWVDRIGKTWIFNSGRQIGRRRPISWLIPRRASPPGSRWLEQRAHSSTSRSRGRWRR